MKMLGKSGALGLNYTMVNAPVLDAKTGLFNFELDGTIYDFMSKTNHVAQAPNTPAYVQHSHREQFYLNEATFNSLFWGAGSAYMPIVMTKKAISDQLLQLLPELGMHYGANTLLSLNISLVPKSQTPFNFDTKKGLVVGEAGDVMIQLVISANSTSSPKMQEAVTFEMDFMMNGNITAQNWIVMPKVESI